MSFVSLELTRLAPRTPLLLMSLSILPVVRRLNMGDDWFATQRIAYFIALNDLPLAGQNHAYICIEKRDEKGFFFYLQLLRLVNWNESNQFDVKFH